MFRFITKLIRWFGYLILSGGFLGLVAVAGVYFYLAPNLPSAESLKDVHLQVPLRVYTRDGLLMADFGEKRRVPVTLDEVPETMIKAFVASEDKNFYEHPGVDWKGLTRAVIHLLKEGRKGPGGSTITMQVVRNYFLGREKTYARKANEILLALKIEREFTKDQILELYLNKIFLGQRAYGVGAAAQVYYGKELDQLTLAQIAMIAGLPQAPSRYNPIANPKGAVERRAYVLNQMQGLADNNIDTMLHQSALNAPVTAERHGLTIEVQAPYVAEMVRAQMVARYGEEVKTLGYKVYTSIDSVLQITAKAALRRALIDYDHRHGYRGAEFRVDLGENDFDADLVLKDIPTLGGLTPALVMSVAEQSAIVYTRQHGEIDLEWEAISWARAHINENRRGPVLKTAGEALQPGDIVRVVRDETGWQLVQIPDVEGAIVSLDASDGSITALSGGFDFTRNQFNRAVQARRQPGSSFKPFIYSAALHEGLTAATLINDAPVVFEDPSLEDEWRPQNYSQKSFGPTRLRVALTKSRNLVSIRILNRIGVEAALDFIERFGFDTDKLPTNLSLALGSGTVTPVEMATGYTVFANGGYRIEPYFLDRIVDSRGEILFQAEPLEVCRDCPEVEMEFARALNGAVVNGNEIDVDEVNLAVLSLNADPESEQDATEELTPARLAPRVISPQNVWLMNSMLRDVVRYGTGRRAWRELGRKDLAGKTGTTNDQQDAWFSGFTANVVTVAWVGFDQLRPLGKKEFGSAAALPMWITFMEEAVGGSDETVLEQPEGLVSVRIDPASGQRVPANFPEAIFESFRIDNVPEDLIFEPSEDPFDGETFITKESSGGVTEELF